MKTTDGGEVNPEPLPAQAGPKTKANVDPSDNPVCRETVGHLSSPNPITAPADTTVHDVIEIMQLHRIGAVLLETDGKLVGVFSERDLVNRILGEDIRPDTPVNTLVSPDPVYLQKTDQIGKAIGLMAELGLRHLPVCSDNLEIEGILSVRQIIQCLAEHYPTEVFNLPPGAEAHPAAPEGG